MPRLNTNAEVLHDLRTVGYVGAGPADVPMGDTDTNGIQWDVSVDETQVKSGMRRDTFLYIPGSAERTFSFSLVNFSLENVADCLGLDPTTRITGAGTSGNPYILSIDPANLTEIASRTWYAQGLREDGWTVRADFPTAQIFAPQVQIKIVTGEPTVIPFRMRVLGVTTIKLYQ